MTVPKVQELNHVAIHVQDLAKSEQFYGEVLGLPRIPRPAFSFPGAWFALGSQELHLIADPELTQASRRHHHFALRVDDPYAARKWMETHGVPGLCGPAPRPDGALQLFFEDPDGYVIEMFTTTGSTLPTET